MKNWLGGITAFLLILSTNFASAGVYYGTDGAVNRPAHYGVKEGYTSRPIHYGMKDKFGEPYYHHAHDGTTHAHPTEIHSNGQVKIEEAQAEVFSTEVRDGSLKDNVERIARQAGWNRVVWNYGYDYNWVGDREHRTVLHGANVQSVMVQLLQSYPLQATFYQTNHVLVVSQRSKQ